MSLWDADISNAAAAVDQCMKLGAVILKPKGGGAPTLPPTYREPAPVPATRLPHTHVHRSRLRAMDLPEVRARDDLDPRRATVARGRRRPVLRRGRGVTQPQGTTRFRGRIYPVALKPASPIRSWRDWPEDVVETLRKWNGRGGGHKLSFWGRGVFKCPDCEQFCEPQMYGSCVLDGVTICDECTIARARAA